MMNLKNGTELLLLDMPLLTKGCAYLSRSAEYLRKPKCLAGNISELEEGMLESLSDLILRVECLMKMDRYW